MGEPVAPLHEGDAEPQNAPSVAHGADGRHAPGKSSGRRRGHWRVLLLAVPLVILVFLAGNLAVSFGVLDVADLAGLKPSLTQGAANATDEVSTIQLSARLEEVAGLLDADSLYRYTQGDVDTATTEAIRALIATSGDAYAQYYTPEEYAEYLRSSEGEYSGIGVVLSLVDGAITVLEVYEGSPAAEAGVVIGDVLLAIDGQRRDWTLEEATEAIRRPLGEEVTLTWRHGEEERETVLVLREVNIPTIVPHLIERDGQAVGYVYLRRFNTHSASELSEALLGLEDRGAQSFVLDLRGNPGGYLSQAIDITSLFVPSGVVVQIEDRGGIVSKKVSGKTVTGKPLAVLVNGGSASASELVAAALKDHGRATIVGELTYGKGTVQDIRKLSWGAALKYTIAHYLSPNGTVLDGVGITPDVVVSPSGASGQEGQANEDEGAGTDTPKDGANLSNHLTSSDYRYEQGVDLQLDAALEAVLASPNT
ncbi:MAG: S41 family peptidase [Coriobacteriales bacterium]|jgi:carboxyl-terminal processing protease|nr:S41 family peptidase [Coriobacteriales bacterium]